MSRLQMALRVLVAIVVLSLAAAPVALALNSAYFSDVSTATVGGLDEAVRAIDNLKDRGVTTGCVPSPDPTVAKYCPGDPIPRWQMALFFARGLAFDLAKQKGAYAAFDGGRSTIGAASTPSPTLGLYVTGGAGKPGLSVDAGPGGGIGIVANGSPTSTGGVTRTGVLGTGADFGLLGFSAAGRGVEGDSNTGTGVFGSSNTGTAVFATSQSGSGVDGESFSGTGVYGRSHNGMGVYGRTDLSTTAGVKGENFGFGGTLFNTAVGVWGQSQSGRGVYGRTDEHESAGVVGENFGGGHGVEGYSHGTLTAVLGANDGTGIGVLGTSQSAAALWGFGATGVTGISNFANGVGVFGSSQVSGGDAGQFIGNVVITGNLKVTGSVSKGSGSFKIDHPLDPTHKYLVHSFVESPDMMNVYNGNVVLDERGEAWVTLPSYFEALNQDFRYQLTGLGRFQPVYVAEEISGNRFKIAGGSPGGKVSWQVTGIRHDAYARANPMVVEEEKPADEQGTYLHPEAFGQSQPPPAQPDWFNNPEIQRLLQRPAEQPEPVATGRP